jgi:fucose permease
MSLAPDYGTLGTAVFWLGFGAGILDMVLSPIVAVLNSQRRSASLNWLHSFYCLGAVLTILASTLALQVGFDWRHACLVLLPLPLVLLLAFTALRFPGLVHGFEKTGRLPLRWLMGELGRWLDRRSG